MTKKKLSPQEVIRNANNRWLTAKKKPSRMRTRHAWTLSRMGSGKKNDDFY